MLSSPHREGVQSSGPRPEMLAADFDCQSVGSKMTRLRRHKMPPEYTGRKQYCEVVDLQRPIRLSMVSALAKTTCLFCLKTTGSHRSAHIS